MLFITKNAEETKHIGYSLAKMICDGEISGKFIALRGEMGVGKTLFTSGFASYFGISGVRSPTYTVVNQYGNNVKIYHFDMYRVTTWEDLYSTGFFDYLDTGVLVIEWSENIEGALPDNALKITISRGENDDQRIFEIEGTDK